MYLLFYTQYEKKKKRLVLPCAAMAHKNKYEIGLERYEIDMR